MKNFSLHVNFQGWYSQETLNQSSTFGSHCSTTLAKQPIRPVAMRLCFIEGAEHANAKGYMLSCIA
jgi:hypothetical protein